MGPILQSLLVFAAVALGISAGFQLLAPFVSREARQARRRMYRDLAAAERTGPAGTPLFKNPDQLVLGQSAAPGAAPGWRAAQRVRLEALLAAGEVRLTPAQFLAAAAAAGLVAGVAGVALLGAVAGLLAAAAGAAVLPLYARYRVAARREKILAQLPNAFSLMARVIRTGNSVPQSMQAVVDAFDGPLAAEFARCQKQQSLGIRPEVTFQEMAIRTGILEVRVFVTAMLIQRQTGGNLSEMLDRLATLVRDRLRLRKQVRTLTAEGRLQGLTLFILPFLVFAALLVVNRQYALVLLEHPSLLLSTGALMAVGVLWIRRIVNFDF